MWLTWQSSTALGILIGAQIPANWSLDFALPLTFIALVVPMLKNRAYIFAAWVAIQAGIDHRRGDRNYGGNDRGHQKQMNLWLTIILAGLATFLIRLSFIAAPGHIEMPMRFTHALTFVPVAVLSAIIFPELLTRDGAVILSLNNARLFTGIIAILIAWRTQNIWLTIAIGMTALFVLQITLGGQV